MATSVDIVLKEESGIHRESEPLSVGIPFAKGEYPAGTTFQVKDANGNSVPAAFKSLCHWPDGSVRWVLAEFLYSLAPHQVETLTVSEQPAPDLPATAIAQKANGWMIRTEVGEILLHANQPVWEFTGANSPTRTEAKLTAKDGLPCHPVANSDWELKHQNPVYIEASLRGHWAQPDEVHLANFTCRLRIYLQSGLANIEIQTHNPKRARHPGGLWDLGDEGSVYFQSLELVTETGHPATARVQRDALNAPENITSTRRFTLYQDSSGGENWDSLNHIDKDGKLTTRFRGYKLTPDNSPAQHGNRANPVLSLEHNQQTLQIAIPTFWQNFPSSLGYSDGIINVGLFPAMVDNQVYELQGGERKTLRHLMTYGSNNDLSWAYAPLCPRLAPEVYESTEAFPWFKANADKSALDDLIQEGLDGPSNFFEKREVIDEYGWRNFGDIFADHETLYQPPGEVPLISHYNNQYDAIYGFARQFALTGDRRWFELMDDLAKHATDIDIYHTEEDRAEYNSGLFWHTDHYLPAHTATHRTFSRHNDTSSTPGQTGGGPAAEHCYTTGLMYHYLMTGQPDSRTAVLDLTQWMVNLHDGSRGLLAQLLAVKKQEVPKLKALVRGEQPNTHRYPFTRGTGNYLTALIDAAILEPDNGWLDKAAIVIRETIHPGDDIGVRNLLDIEIGWSYLILLSAMARFLWLKWQYQELDESYLYTHEALLKYTAWMQKNERPFLEEPEQLEFANDTWVAQDIRKAMLLFNAAELSEGAEADGYRDTATAWLEQACETLQHSPEKYFSRILIILAQNYGPQHSAQHTRDTCTKPSTVNIGASGRPLLTWPQLAARILQRIGLGITQFRPAREKAWLDARMNR